MASNVHSHKSRPEPETASGVVVWSQPMTVFWSLVIRSANAMLKAAGAR